MTTLIVKLRRWSDAIADQVLADCGASDGGRRMPALGFFRALAPDDRAREVEDRIRAHPAVRKVGVEAGLEHYGLTSYAPWSGEGAVSSEVYPVSGLTYAFHFPVTNGPGKRLHVWLRSASQPASFYPTEGFKEGTEYTVTLNADQQTNPGGVVTFASTPTTQNFSDGAVWLTNWMFPGPVTPHSWPESRHAIARAKKIPLADTSRLIGISDSGTVAHDSLPPDPPTGRRWHGAMSVVAGTNDLWSQTVDGVRTSFNFPFPRFKAYSSEPAVNAYVNGVETPCTFSDYVYNAKVQEAFGVGTFATPPPAGAEVRFQGDEDRCDDFAQCRPISLAASPHGSGTLSVAVGSGDDSLPTSGVAPEASFAFAAIASSTSRPSVDIWASVDAIMLLAAGPGETVNGRAGIGPVSVLNCSWGMAYSLTADQYDVQFALLSAACDYAVARDVLIVAAAGNDGFNYDTHDPYGRGAGTWRPMPAGHPAALVVGGICEHDGRMDIGPGGPNGRQYSRIGSRIDVTAAGRYYWTAADGFVWKSKFMPDRYWMFGGTSGASPHVAGTAWRVRAIHPGLSASETKQIIKETGDRTYRPADYDPYFSCGVLNAAKACAKAASLRSPGSVWPHVQFFKPPRETTPPYDLPINLYSPDPPDAYGFCSGLTARVNDGPWAYTTPGGDTTLNGPVEIDLEPFSCLPNGSDDPTATIELWLGWIRLYSGPKTTIQATASTDGALQRLKVVARNGSGGYAEETFSDVAVATLESASFTPEDFTPRPRIVRVEAGGVPVYASVSPGADAVAAEATASAATVSVSAARSLVAGSASTASQGFVGATALSSLQASSVASSAGTISVLSIGHRIRAVGGGVPAYAALVPGADGYAGAASASSGALAIGAQVPAPAATATASAGGIILPLGLPAAAGTSAAGVASVSAARTVPAATATASVGGVGLLAGLPAVTGAAQASGVAVSASLAATAASASSSAGSVVFGVSAPVPSASATASVGEATIFAAVPLSAALATATAASIQIPELPRRRVDVNAETVAIGVLAQTIRIHTKAQRFPVGIRAKRG